MGSASRAFDSGVRAFGLNDQALGSAGRALELGRSSLRLDRSSVRLGRSRTSRLGRSSFRLERSSFGLGRSGSRIGRSSLRLGRSSVRLGRSSPRLGFSCGKSLFQQVQGREQIPVTDRFLTRSEPPTSVRCGAAYFSRGSRCDLLLRMRPAARRAAVGQRHLELDLRELLRCIADLAQATAASARRHAGNRTAAPTSALPTLGSWIVTAFPAIRRPGPPRRARHARWRSMPVVQRHGLLDERLQPASASLVRRVCTGPVRRPVREREFVRLGPNSFSAPAASCPAERASPARHHFAPLHPGLGRMAAPPCIDRRIPLPCVVLRTAEIVGMPWHLRVVCRAISEQLLRLGSSPGVHEQDSRAVDDNQVAGLEVDARAGSSALPKADRDRNPRLAPARLP